MNEVKPMKKTVLYQTLVMSFLLYSCVSSSGERATLVQRVNEIYTEVFGCYGQWDSLARADGGTDAPNGLDAKFCTLDWNMLVAQVNDCDEKNNEGGMIGFFDADYWIMGQDWQDLSVSDVQVKDISGQTAVVELVLHNCGSTEPVRLEMVKENGLWKIDNFIDMAHDVDWKSSMKEYLAENEKNN